MTVRTLAVKRWNHVRQGAFSTATEEGKIEWTGCRIKSGMTVEFGTDVIQAGVSPSTMVRRISRRKPS
jgi:hypothetical protein